MRTLGRMRPSISLSYLLLSCSMAGFEVRILPKVRMAGEEFVHKDGVWALQVSGGTREGSLR
jgi:hypothetical protein